MSDDVVPSWIPNREAESPGAVNIRRRPIVGAGIHLAGHDHSSGQVDFIQHGAAALGPVAYSLLRAESTSLYEHRGKRMGSTLDWLRKLTAQAEKLRPIDEEGAHKLYRQNARLYIWDLIGFVYETCEHLACIFDSVRRYRAGQVSDLGAAMLDFDKPAYDVFASAEFADLSWWRAELGTLPQAERFALLTPRQQALLTESCDLLDARMILALSTVRFIYTKDLHRLAIRRRHAVSLLDVERGLAWVSQDAEEGKADLEALEAGGLAVADTDGKGGPIVELILPLSRAMLNELFGCLIQARWLVEAVSWATLGRVENPSRIPFVFDMDARTSARSQSEWDGLLSAYTGIDLEYIEKHGREKRARVDVLATLDRPKAPRSRAERRHGAQSKSRRQHSK